MFSRAVTRLLLTASLLVPGCGDDDEPTGNLDGGLPDAGDSRAADAALAASCGRWVRAQYMQEPPANALAYGMEYNDMGTFSQYVCRFVDQLDGEQIVLQGKGVFGFSCYAILPAASNAVAKVQPSADFEVLTDTQSCARMVPYREDQANGRWLPTGTDARGNPTYSCRGVVKSLEGGSMETSMPLGRYEPETKRCVFEWYSTVRAAPAPDSTETFEMLAVPSP
jgi:hypothetical protein